MIYLIVVAIIVATGLISIKYDSSKKSYLDMPTTSTLKGLFMIPIMSVHLPGESVGRFEDLVGSFAFVGVTLFFMLSSYGLTLSVRKKKNYLKSFFRNRVLVLLIPFLIAVGLKLAVGSDWRSGGVQFVFVLLLFYLVFWLCHTFIKKQSVANAIIVCFVVLYSLGGYFVLCKTVIHSIGFSWYVESLGFAYGIVLAGFDNQISKLLSKGYFVQIACYGIASAVIGVAYLKLKAIYFVGEYLVRALLGIAIIMLLVAISRRFTIANKASLKLGAISTEMFYYHGFVIYLLSVAIPQNISSSWFSSVVIIGTICLALAMNYVDTFITKRIKK